MQYEIDIRHHNEGQTWASEGHAQQRNPAYMPSGLALLRSRSWLCFSSFSSAALQGTQFQPTNSVWLFVRMRLTWSPLSCQWTLARFMSGSQGLRIVKELRRRVSKHLPPLSNTRITDHQVVQPARRSLRCLGTHTVTMSSLETLDYNKATREEFTRRLLSLPDRSNQPKWSAYRTSLNKILDLLAHHPAMAPNINQTYMTPANSKNKVYFMWDFVGRTRATLENAKEATSKDSAFVDVLSRSMMAVDLIKDRTGKLDMMVGGPHPGSSDKAEFGNEVEHAADELGAIK